ncbi:MAG: InlB B-repeat-containing protein [Oscillospiraceae bacterium]
MTTKLKKLLTSLLAFSLVLGMLPMGTMASAAANITGDNVDIEEYHVTEDKIPALEAYAKANNPNLPVDGRYLAEIHIIFKNDPVINVIDSLIYDHWMGSCAIWNYDDHQPEDITSIEMGYREIGKPDKFLTIPAENLNIQRFDKKHSIVDFAEISLSDSAENFTLSFQYVVPAGFDNVQPAPENIKLPTEVTQNTPFAFGTPPYGTMTIPESYAFHGWYSDEICQTPMNETDQITQNTTVYGYWTKTPAPTYTLTFAYVTEGVAGVVAPPEGVTVQGAILFEEQYRYDEKLNYGTGVIPAGYKFHGWFLYPNCTTPAGTSTVVTTDDTLYGYWTKTPDPIVPAEKYAFSVSYVFTDGEKPAEGFEDYVEHLEVGADYSAEVLVAPEGYHQLDGFDITGATLLTGKMPANNVSVTFHYALDEPIVTPPVEPPVEPPVTPPSPSYSYYRATVRYLALDTNAVLADAYSTDTIREGRSYDVSEQAALAISGYTIDHVEGATSGTLNGNVTVTVWYSAETVLENPDVPLVDVPEVPPTTPPAPDASGETDEVILVDPETPLGDLPQTGIVAEAADPANTLGFAALAASMAMAGLAVALNRKREDAE